MTPDLDAIVELRKAWQAADLGAPRMKAYYAYCKATDAFDFAALAARLAALEGALLDAYDHLPGPVFASLSGDTGRLLIELAHARNPHAGKGRVTNRRTDMRLRENRHPATPDPDSEERTP